MNSTHQTNGNTQVNGVRNDFNGKVDRLYLLGKSKKVQWDSRRRYRTI